MADLDASIMAALDDVRGDDNPPDNDNVDTSAADPIVDDTTTAADTTADPVVADPAAKAEDKVVEPVVDENDFSTVPERDATGRTNRIPHPRVAKMVEGAVKKATKAWETEKTSLSTQNQTYVKRLENIQQVEHAMFNDQRRFIQMLRTIPGYAELLPTDGAKPAAAGAAVVAMEADDPEPQPDVVENGVPIGWTHAGLAKMRAWDRRQATKDALKAAEEKYGKPLSQFTTAQAAHEKNVDQARRIAAELDGATKWEGFVEHAPEILAQLQNPANDKLSLRDIYERVYIGKLKMTQAEMRTALMAEMEKSPRSTAAGAGGQSRVAAAAAASNKPLEDQILDKLRAL